MKTFLFTAKIKFCNYKLLYDWKIKSVTALLLERFVRNYLE